MDVILEENPWDNPWYGQPVRHARAARKGWRGRRTMRNPTGVGALTQNWLQGLDMQDIAAAGVGLLATTAIPPMVLTKADTTQEKLLRVLASAAVAVGVGMAGSAVAGKSAGKAALAGGIAGTVVQLIQSFTTLLPVGSSGSSVRRVLGGPSRAALGSGIHRYPAAAYDESFQDVRLR